MTVSGVWPGSVFAAHPADQGSQIDGYLPHRGAGHKRQTPGAIVSAQQSKKRWRDVCSAGHGVGAIDDVLRVKQLCDRLKTEYGAAREGLGRLSAASA